MRILPENLKLYALTDPNAHPELSLGEQVEQAIAGGATCIQLREKDQDRETFLNAARELVKVCNKHHVPLIINDDLDIALDVHAACLLYTSPSPRDKRQSRMPSSA